MSDHGRAYRHQPQFSDVFYLWIPLSVVVVAYQKLSTVVRGGAMVSPIKGHARLSRRRQNLFHAAIFVERDGKRWF